MCRQACRNGLIMGGLILGFASKTGIGFYIALAGLVSWLLQQRLVL